MKIHLHRASFFFKTSIVKVKWKIRVFFVSSTCLTASNYEEGDYGPPFDMSYAPRHPPAVKYCIK